MWYGSEGGKLEDRPGTSLMCYQNVRLWVTTLRHWNEGANRTDKEIRFRHV